MELCDINKIKYILEKHGFRFSKSLGQNFLIEPKVPQKIAELSGIDKDTNVIEVGPGIGALTTELCRRAGKVVAVEIDKRLIPVLEETLSEFDNLVIENDDILKTDIAKLTSKNFINDKIIACANLPYYITTPAITKLIDSDIFDSITVMVQKEVARRMVAKAGTPEYGAFTVYVNYYTEPKILFDVPAGCFVPRPKVDSSVIRLDRRRVAPADVHDKEMFFRVVKAAFGQRRKTLINALDTVFGKELSKKQIEKIVFSCGLDTKIRGEKLTIGDFATISNIFNNMIGEYMDKKS